MRESNASIFLGMNKFSPKMSMFLGLLATMGFGWVTVLIFLEPLILPSMSDLEFFTGSITGTHTAQVSQYGHETQVEFSVAMARPVAIEGKAWVASLPITQQSVPVSTSARIGLLKSELNNPQTNIFGRPISFRILFLEVSGTVLATPEKYSEWLKPNNRDGKLVCSLMFLMSVYLTYDGYRRKKFQDANPWAADLK